MNNIVANVDNHAPSTHNDSNTVKEPSQTNTSETENDSKEKSVKRKRSRWGTTDSDPVTEGTSKSETSKAENDAPKPEQKKKSRWGGQAKLDAPLPGAPLTPAQMQQMQQMQMAVMGGTGSMNGVVIDPSRLTEFDKVRLKLEDLNKRLVAPLGTIDTRPPEQRTPSPEPIYDNKGIRLNTRQNRMRDKIIEERDKLLEEATKLNPTFQPFGMVKAKKQFTCRLEIPQNQNPDYNFMGLIIGPRGNTHRRMEQETGTKIAVRGKGATKKAGAKGGKVYAHDDEEMHVMIIGDTQAGVDKAAKMIRELLVPVSETASIHKAAQLRELAAINGTQRSELACRICGALGHKIVDCPERSGARWTPANVFCDICGATTHIAKDCVTKTQAVSGASATAVTSSSSSSSSSTGAGAGGGGGMPAGAGIHDEYLSFMAEITGEKQPEAVANAPAPTAASKKAAAALVAASAALPPNFPAPPIPPPFIPPFMPPFPGFGLPGMPQWPPAPQWGPPPGFPPLIPTSADAYAQQFAYMSYGAPGAAYGAYGAYGSNGGENAPGDDNTSDGSATGGGGGEDMLTDEGLHSSEEAAILFPSGYGQYPGVSGDEAPGT